MNRAKRHTLALLLLPALFAAPHQTAAQSAFERQATLNLKSASVATPYQNNNGSVPSPSVYSGPLFTLNHAWPTQSLPPLTNAPWQAAIQNQPITTQNAPAYAAALKAAVMANAVTLITDYPNWNAVAAGWYNEPWLGSQREAIHGSYAAGEFGPSVFPNTGLRATFDTHAVTYYDARAAYSLHKVWGATSLKPNIQVQSPQFEEGSLIVKAATFTSNSPAPALGWWDAMNGAQVWDLYLGTGSATQPRPGYVAQFDIIVKDSQSSPATGWVFMTLVYDASVTGSLWDKMVPLGVQWGNDPQATSDTMPLVENWINPKAPLYATETLGWGGRLSGPNDGARNNIAVNGQVMINAPDSGCISCHSTAQWDVKAHKMITFLLPSFVSSSPPGFQTCGDDGKPDPNGSNICSPAPGSAHWMKWFQNRLGTQPMDPGSIAMDFDEVFSFKSLKLWWLAVGPKTQPTPLLTRNFTLSPRYNQYTGAPLPKPEPVK